MKRADAVKVELDPLAYVDGRNISLVHGARTKLTTEVYGKSYVAEVTARLLYEPYIEILYSPREGTERTQTVRLTQTPCYFGGFRWWLVCPTCNRRVCRLYLLNEHYRCSQCHNLTYRSRKRNRHSEIYPAQRELDRYEHAQKLMERLRTQQYAGKPTKRYLKIVELLKDFDNLKT